MERLFFRDQGQEPQHFPSHGAVCNLIADDLGSNIHFVEVTERDHPSERVYESVRAVLYHLHDLTGYIGCLGVSSNGLGLI